MSLSRSVVLAALVASACTPSAPVCALGPARPPGDAWLWHVTKPGAPGSLWLYGTIHTAGGADVPPAAMRALASSTHFASELGDVEPDPKKLAELARIPAGGKPLDALIPADDWYDLEIVMHGTLEPDALRHARPWFAMMRLMSKVAPGPHPSMDVALAERAHAAHLPIAPLESWDEQMVALDAAVTPADLLETLHARRTIQCTEDRLRAAYLAGDLAYLVPALKVRDARLLTERNARWMPQLEAFVVRAPATTTFVAVGLGHLIGEENLVSSLERAGYVVDRSRTPPVPPR